MQEMLSSPTLCRNQNDSIQGNQKHSKSNMYLTLEEIPVSCHTCARLSFQDLSSRRSACGPRKNLFPYSRRFRLPTLELFTFLHFHSESVCAELKSLTRKRAAACRIEQLLFLLFESDHCQDLALVHHSTLIVK